VHELDRAAEVLSAAGVRLALEFASYSPLDSLAATVAVCERIGWERCGVLLDAWHFFMSGAPWPCASGHSAGADRARPSVRRAGAENNRPPV
jgi:sugar phosphate isomerase/epimerase